MSINPHAAGLYPLLDPEWRAKLRHAGVLVLIPFVGWPMVLGYRRELVEHFYRPKLQAMPEWRGRHREHFTNGLRAIAVIQTYLLPLWAAVAYLLLDRGFSPGWASCLGVALCAVFPIFSNIAFPAVLAACSLPIAGGPYLTRWEALLLGLLFHAVIFLVPAGFLRVSATGRFRSALNVRRTLPFIMRRRHDYLKAWWFGLWMNFPALPVVVVAPWAIFWGYVASVALFQQLLMGETDDRNSRPKNRDGWLAEAALRYGEPPTFGPTTGRIWYIESIALHGGKVVPCLRTRWASVPLPRRFSGPQPQGSHSE